MCEVEGSRMLNETGVAVGSENEVLLEKRFGSEGAIDGQSLYPPLIEPYPESQKVVCTRQIAT